MTAKGLTESTKADDISNHTSEPELATGNVKPETVPMAEADDEGWAKAREMVRSAPPPPLSAEATRELLGRAVTAPPAAKTPLKAIVLVLIIAAAIAGVTYLTFGPDLLEKVSGDSQTSTSGAPPTAAQDKAPSKESAATAAKSAAIKKGLATVNVRGDPSLGKPPIAKLNGGDKVERLAESGVWLKIRFNADGKAREGWIRRDMLE